MATEENRRVISERTQALSCFDNEINSYNQTAVLLHHLKVYLFIYLTNIDQGPTVKKLFHIHYL